MTWTDRRRPVRSMHHLQPRAIYYKKSQTPPVICDLVLHVLYCRYVTAVSPYSDSSTIFKLARRFWLESRASERAVDGGRRRWHVGLTDDPSLLALHCTAPHRTCSRRRVNLKLERRPPLPANARRINRRFVARSFSGRKALVSMGAQASTQCRVCCLSSLASCRSPTTAKNHNVRTHSFHRRNEIPGFTDRSRPERNQPVAGMALRPARSIA